MAVARPASTARVRESFTVHPVVALTGPRQCGKTTLARSIAANVTGSTYWIVYPGDEAYSLDDRISVLPVAAIPELAAAIG